MKTARKATEHYLLPLNLALLSFFGLFLIYELDKWMYKESAEATSIFAVGLIGLCTLLLISAVKFRNPYYQAFCALLAIIALAFLI